MKEYLEHIWSTTLNPPFELHQVEKYNLNKDFKSFLTTITSFNISENDLSSSRINLTNHIVYDKQTNFQEFIASFVKPEIFFVFDVMKLFTTIDTVPMYSSDTKEVPGQVTFYSCESTDTNHHGDLMFAIRNVDETPIKIILNNRLELTVQVRELIWLPLYFANDPTTAYYLDVQGKAITYHVLFGVLLPVISDYTFLNAKLYHKSQQECI